MSVLKGKNEYTASPFFSNFRSSGIFKNPERIEGSVMNTSVSEVCSHTWLTE